MASIQEIIGAEKAAMLAAVKERLRAVAAELIADTPSRSGRTRCSFVASIGSPESDTDPKGRGAGIDPAGQGALDQINSVIDSVELGDRLFITSDYPNARRQDQGDRHDAPHHMVERAAQGWAK